MIEINLLEPKAEQMALKNYWILPLWKQCKKAKFMVLTIKRTYLPSSYTLKKVIALQVKN